MNLDFNTLFVLLSRGDTSSIWQPLLLVFVPPLLTALSGKFYYVWAQMSKYLGSFFGVRPTSTLTLLGTMGFRSGYFSDNKVSSSYSDSFLAVTHYIVKNKLCNCIYESSDFLQKDNPVYVLKKPDNFYIEDGIFAEINYFESEGNAKIPNIEINLMSSTKDIDGLKEFVKKCMSVREKFILETKHEKLYHFIYEGNQTYSHNLISDLSNKNNMNFETFDNMFCEHREKLMKRIDLLKDIAYYKRNGLKRKLGCLFYGEPGCGKTRTVMSIANYDKRHIIEVPMSRVKTNEEFEKIISLTQINGITFSKEQVIFLFDEIDRGSNVVHDKGANIKALTPIEQAEMAANIAINRIEGSGNSNSNGNSNGNNNNNRDDLSFDTILSRLDGIGGYNGVIIIGTTNNKDKLDPALYRHGRLDPYYFTFSRREDIKDMIEHSYEIKLTESQISRLPDRVNKIAPSTVKKYIHDNKDNLEDLIDALRKYTEEKAAEEKIAAEKAATLKVAVEKILAERATVAEIAAEKVAMYEYTEKFTGENTRKNTDVEEVVDNTPKKIFMKTSNAASNTEETSGGNVRRKYLRF